MSARRWDLVVAGVELACGIGVAAYFVVSTVVHVAVARAAHAQGRRLAWLWVDQGVWITALRGGTTVEALNAELDGSERWEWVDEQTPTAAGEP
jgi:hypothetical protein